MGGMGAWPAWYCRVSSKRDLEAPLALARVLLSVRENGCASSSHSNCDAFYPSRDVPLFLSAYTTRSSKNLGLQEQSGGGKRDNHNTWFDKSTVAPDWYQPVL